MTDKHYMTYKHYLMRTTGRDSEAHYADYLAQFDAAYRKLSEKMRRQYHVIRQSYVSLS